MNDGESINYFGETNFRNQQTRFGIKNRDRTRHMYVVGKSGVGKSTLLENMAIQDIQNGEGVAVLDPHGSFAEKMLDYIPEHRIKDVIYFAPFDTEHPMSFNVLEDVGADKRHLVVSGLMSTFKKIWVDAWSARMEYILSNTLLALLEYPGSTLLGVNRMLSDKDFRKKVVDNITDSAVKAFWTEEFAKYTERMAAEAVPAIQNKIGQLTANPLIRNIIGQPKSSFDIREVMDNKKILIINLSKGRIGDQNTSLLGSMIITKIYLAAMSRANVSHSRMGDLPAFYFYVDEFQSFANESFADILSEARKYKLALIIAHQYIAQMDESVRDAVFGNVGTSISFRVGPLDAEVLEKVYSPQFLATDLINLGMAQIYLSLMINDIGSPPFSAKTLFPIARPPITYRNDVIEWTRLKFALPRATVEQNIRDWFGPAPIAYVPSEAPKKYPPSANNKPYVPVNKPIAVPVVQQEVSKPIVTPQVFVKKEYEKKPYIEKPKEHNPFKKALENIPTIEEKIGQPISEEMNILLDKIDSSVKTEPVIKKEINPFVGEKTLRETITPVKFAERGATLENRNLLKEALMKATSNKPEVLENLPEIKKEPVTSSTELKEISHTELLKVLE
jgi:Type IV secretion-system coupling protein DNA-binding domain